MNRFNRFQKGIPSKNIRDLIKLKQLTKFSDFTEIYSDFLCMIEVDKFTIIEAKNQHGVAYNFYGYVDLFTGGAVYLGKGQLYNAIFGTEDKTVILKLTGSTLVVKSPGEQVQDYVLTEPIVVPSMFQIMKSPHVLLKVREDFPELFV